MEKELEALKWRHYLLEARTQALSIFDTLCSDIETRLMVKLMAYDTDEFWSNDLDDALEKGDSFTATCVILDNIKETLAGKGIYPLESLPFAFRISELSDLV